MTHSQGKEINKTSQSTASRVWEFIRTSRLEPVVLLHGIAGGLRATPFHQLIQDKICLQDFNQPREYCHYLSQSKSSPLKDKILAEVATFTTFKEFAILIPAIITAFFIGSWCDKFTNGKRYCLLSSSFCQLLEGFLFLLNSIFMNAPASYVIYSFLPPSIFGNEFGFLTAVYAFTAANVKDEERAARYIAISLLRTIGATFGHFCGGFIIAMNPVLNSDQLQNYSGNFIISSGCSIAALVWAFIFVNENPKDEGTLLQNNSQTKPAVNDSTLDQRQSTSSPWKTFKEIVNFENVTNTYKVVMKKREGTERLRMWLMILTVNLVLLPVFGRSAVIYPLVQKLYKWNSVVYSNLTSISGVIHIVFTLIITPVLFKVFHPNDCQTAMVGVVTGILADVFIGSLITPWGFYLHAFLSSLMTISDTGARAYLSKLLPKEEVSAMFAITLVIEAILKCITAYCFAFLLRITISSYPTFVFHFMVLLLLTALIILVYVDLTTKYPMKSHTKSPSGKTEDTKL